MLFLSLLLLKLLCSTFFHMLFLAHLLFSFFLSFFLQAFSICFSLHASFFQYALLSAFASCRLCTRLCQTSSACHSSSSSSSSSLCLPLCYSVSPSHMLLACYSFNSSMPFFCKHMPLWTTMPLRTSGSSSTCKRVRPLATSRAKSAGGWRVKQRLRAT